MEAPEKKLQLKSRNTLKFIVNDQSGTSRTEQAFSPHSMRESDDLGSIDDPEKA